MRCPNDNFDLILKTQENTYAYCCEHCDGVFLKRKEVEAFKYNFETDFLERAFSKNRTTKINCDCANCEQKMHNVFIEGISIDLCVNCKGVFFQKGQLTQIKERYIGISHQDDFTNNFLPWPLLAMKSVYKLFTTDTDSKSRPFYKWITIVTVIFFSLWLILG